MLKSGQTKALNTEDEMIKRVYRRKFVNKGIKKELKSEMFRLFEKQEKSGTTTAISEINNIVLYIKGEKNSSDVLQSMRKNSSISSILNDANNEELAILNHTLTSSKSEFLNTLYQKNITGNVIKTISNTGESIVKWGSGKISTKECIVELGEKGCSSIGKHCGKVLCQALIPVPILNSIVGSLVGSALISKVYNNTLYKIQYAKEEERRKQEEIYKAIMRYYAEQARRKEIQQLINVNVEQAVNHSIESIIQSSVFKEIILEASSYFEKSAECEKQIASCVLLTLQLQEYRRQLQEYLNCYFIGYEHCIDSVLDLINFSLRMGDYDNAITEVNKVTELFGKSPIIKDTEDFKNKIFGNSDISF